MSPGSRLHPPAVLSATLAGFVLAHMLDYAIVYPDPHERAHVLAHTGHEYFRSVTGSAWTLLGLALVLALAQGVSRSPRGRSPRAAVALLATAQSVFFVAVEVGERFASHEPLRALLRGPLLAVGLLAQVAVAALLVGLLVAAERTGRRYAVVTTTPFALPPWPRGATPYVTVYRTTTYRGRAAARAPPAS